MTEFINQYSINASCKVVADDSAERERKKPPKNHLIHFQKLSLSPAFMHFAHESRFRRQVVAARTGSLQEERHN